jgi:hypothetical protein
VDGGPALTVTSWATLKGHDDGVVRWDWQYLLILVGVMVFIAIVSAVVW